jgi:hypothetical protein
MTLTSPDSLLRAVRRGSFLPFPDILRLVLDVFGPLGMALMIGALLVIAVEAARWLWG